MNGRKARKLRQRARSLTVGMPNVAYSVDSNGSRRVIEASTRGVYLELKKKYKNRKKR